MTIVCPQCGQDVRSAARFCPRCGRLLKDQLDAGVRALLIDTHYWDTAATLEEAFAQLTPEMRVVAEKAVDKIGIQNRDGTYFCHMACALGSTLMTETLTDIRTFLEENPREVLFIVIQDDISPADTEATFKEVGLDQYLFNHVPGEPWPTLRQMIDAGELLVGAGDVRVDDTVNERYLAMAESKLHHARPLKIVVDAGNGMGGIYGPPLLEALGLAEVEHNARNNRMRAR